MDAKEKYMNMISRMREMAEQEIDEKTGIEEKDEGFTENIAIEDDGTPKKLQKKKDAKPKQNEPVPDPAVTNNYDPEDVIISIIENPDEGLQGKNPIKRKTNKSEKNNGKTSEETSPSDAKPDTSREIKMPISDVKEADDPGIPAVDPGKDSKGEDNKIKDKAIDEEKNTEKHEDVYDLLDEMDMDMSATRYMDRPKKEPVKPVLVDPAAESPSSSKTPADENTAVPNIAKSATQDAPELLPAANKPSHRRRGHHTAKSRKIKYVDMSGNEITKFCLINEITGMTYILNHTNAIGSALDEDIILADEYVSRHHAILTIEKDNFYIEDLGSTNGTKVNGFKIDSKTQLELGNKLTLGETQLSLMPLRSQPQHENEYQEPAIQPPSAEKAIPEDQPAEPTVEETPPRGIQSSMHLILFRLDTGEAYYVSNQTTTIGREEGNDIVIPEPEGHFISADHAVIEIKGKDIYLRDLDSSNGTFVNGSRIKRKIIYPGNTIKIANLEFEVAEG